MQEAGFNDPQVLLSARGLHRGAGCFFRVCQERRLCRTPRLGPCSGRDLGLLRRALAFVKLRSLSLQTRALKSLARVGYAIVSARAAGVQPCLWGFHFFLDGRWKTSV